MIPPSKNLSLLAWAYFWIFLFFFHSQYVQLSTNVYVTYAFYTALMTGAYKDYIMNFKIKICSSLVLFFFLIILDVIGSLNFFIKFRIV